MCDSILCPIEPQRRYVFGLSARACVRRPGGLHARMRASVPKMRHFPPACRRLLACLFKCAVDNDFLTVVIADLYSDSIGTRLSDTDLTVLCAIDGVLRR